MYFVHKRKKRFKIGILCHASFGGSARVATELATELAQQGHGVHLFTLGHPAWKNRPHLRYHVIERMHPNHPAALHTEWHPEEQQRFLTCLQDVIYCEQLDILHFHYAVPFALLAEKVKCRLGHHAPWLVGTLHGTDVSHFGQDSSVRWQLAKALQKMDRLTAVSLDYACLAAERFQLTRYPDVIPNFVDLNQFQPPPAGQQRSNGSGQSKLKIVHISNFRPVKDPLSMARIFAALHHHVDAELWLVGEGPEMDTVKHYFHEQGLQDAVRYWGLCHRVAPILAQADLLLMTSRAESFCLAALEAMACGVPVLATRVGGIPEVVLHGKTGYLFAVGDEETAVQQGIDLITSHNKRQAMSKAAVVQARRFNQRIVIPAYIDLYESLTTPCAPQMIDNSFSAPPWNPVFQLGNIMV